MDDELAGPTQKRSVRRTRVIILYRTTYHRLHVAQRGVCVMFEYAMHNFDVAPRI